MHTYIYEIWNSAKYYLKKKYVPGQGQVNKILVATSSTTETYIPFDVDLLDLFPPQLSPKKVK